MIQFVMLHQLLLVIYISVGEGWVSQGKILCQPNQGLSRHPPVDNSAPTVNDFALHL